MPTHAELHRNGVIRLVVAAGVLLTVGVVAGGGALAGWPALAVAIDMAVTAGWLLTHRGRAVPEPAEAA